MNFKSLSLVGGVLMMLVAALAMLGGAEKIPSAPLALLQVGMATVLISMATKERSWSTFLQIAGALLLAGYAVAAWFTLVPPSQADSGNSWAFVLVYGILFLNMTSRKVESQGMYRGWFST